MQPLDNNYILLGANKQRHCPGDVERMAGAIGPAMSSIEVYRAEM